MNYNTICIDGVCIDSATLQSTLSKLQNYVIQDCQWNNWSNWSPCSKPCNSGLQVRNRTILQESQNKGEPCFGPSEEVQVCNTEECPIHCTLGEWSSNWSPCNKPCGIGSEYKKRAYFSSQGELCLLPLEEESQLCNVGPCPLY